MELIERITDAIQSSNINFLIGSGLSMPFIPTLGNIETMLTELDSHPTKGRLAWQIAKASLYKKYFENVMAKNLESNCSDNELFRGVLSNYMSFLNIFNALILYRKNTLLNKQVNIFTTNIDIFLDRAIEELHLEFNDGFKGRIYPSFNLSNFLFSYLKTSLHYSNTTEVPVFNLLKLHGSINWSKHPNSDLITLDAHLQQIEELSKLLTETGYEQLLVNIPDNMGSNELMELSRELSKSNQDKPHMIEAFINKYETIQIVNPTKEKFKSSILNVYYYELLRMFANELEKENCILFSLGISFRDEHIREIVLRAANSNPTLQIYVIAYDKLAKAEIAKCLRVEEFSIKNNNIKIIDFNDLSGNINESGADNSNSDKVLDFEALIKMLFQPIKSQAV